LLVRDSRAAAIVQAIQYAAGFAHIPDCKTGSMNAVSQQLKNIAFRRNGDSALIGAAATGDELRFQQTLQKSFAKPCKRFLKITGSLDLTVNWSADFEWPDESDRRLAELLAAKNATTANPNESKIGAVGEFLTQCFCDESEEITPFVALTAGEMLLRHVERFSAKDASTIFVGLVRLAAEPFVLPDELTLTGECLVYNLVAVCEVPFVLSILLESLRHSKQLRETARANLARILFDSTDTDGTPHACVLANVRHWLSPFVRANCWADSVESTWAVKKTESHWQKHLSRFAALATSGGFVSADRIAIGAAVPDEFDVQQLNLAVRHAKFDKPSPVLSLAAEIGSGKQPDRKTKPRKIADLSRGLVCSEQSDWAHFALMRSGMHLAADVVSLTWDQPSIRLGVAAFGSRIVGGEWSREILIDNKTVDPPSSWGCTCWYLDDEVAFAELESTDAGPVRHVRQVLLSLVDHFAVLTDSVTCENSRAEVTFNSRLQLHGVVATSNSITRELRLPGMDLDVRVLPTWLEDDRLQSAAGDCRQIAGDLSLSGSGVGGVTLPLLLDWNLKRVSSEADWNRLTVTEERCVKTAWDAVAFRARIGRLQMLIYRSLRPGDSLRAVLGHNTGNETVYAHVANSGSIVPLVMVDSEP